MNPKYATGLVVSSLNALALRRTGAPAKVRPTTAICYVLF